MSAPTALYRRYRPDSFAQVIGQEHVTAPLMTALDKNRVNHAYLFSGPRGCGKTTSARILARCLNCAKGPTSHPCGECESCVELARGGAGSLDVIEIDAASHGGVDDARDLRERATFAPIRDRYKIFIIDEAHMVTSAGFNALLKIVEEPPEHIKFIFATTEPDKVIGTIRSRTHHYPFRLVPPEPLMAYLAQLCEQEGVAVAPGVLSLVVRAGGGSVRDSLSVLDQLMAGAGASGLDYDLAVELLGYTHASLLDDVVDALAAGDSATVFKSVDRVIQTGHDPRRFVEDLLERFRDLIIVQAMPESAHAILRGTPDELIARMQTQAAQLGPAELSRAADVTNAAFNEMTGATSPRLHLELLGARLLLPGADASLRGLATRLDQLERRLNYAGETAAAAPAATASDAGPAMGAMPAASTAADSAAGSAKAGLAAVRAELARAREAAGAETAARHATEGRKPAVHGTDAAPAVPAPAQPAPVQPMQQPEPAATTAAQSAPVQSTPAQSTPVQPVPAVQPQAAQTQAAPPHQAQPNPAQAATTPAAPAASGSTSGIEMIRRAWPEILGALRSIRMASWVIVNQNVVPQTFDGHELRVGLPSSGLIATFRDSGHMENLQQAIKTVLGISIQIHPADGEAPKASAEPNPKVPAGDARPAPQEIAGSRSGAQASPADAAYDSWGLPSAQAAAAPKTAPAAPAPVQPAPAAPATPENAAPERPSPAGTPQAPPAGVPQQEPWDGPTEPSEYWDEPDSDGHPPIDPWAEPDGTGTDPRPDAVAPDAVEPAAAPAAQTPAAYTPPKVSPISAWTTGWDTPSEPPAAAATPAEPETPRRSTMLAEKVAGEAARNANGGAAEEWGASLGHTRQAQVSDPGWGSMASAPDWAQTAPASAAAAQQHGTVAAPAHALSTDGAAPVQPPAAPAQPQSTEDDAPGAPESLSMYQRLANSPAAQAARMEPAAANVPAAEDVPSPDDVTIEESGVVGQAAVERILGGVLVEERALTLPN